MDGNGTGTDKKGAAAGRTVELLIPVYKPGVELAVLLDRMRHQTAPPQSIHLLVTASEQEFEQVRGRYERFWKDLEDKSDGANGLALRFTRIAPEEFDHGGTRHLGASQSHADVLLFMTQDAAPDDEYLVERLLEALESPDGGPETAAAYARQLPAADCNAIERFTRAFNYPDESRIKTAADLPALGIKTFFCSNVCAAYRRDIYEKQGGFIRRTIFNEDMIFTAGLIRAGYGVAYAAGARVVHSHNYSGLKQLRRNFDLAVSQADHPEVFEGIASEGEGIRLVKAAAAHLCATGRFWLLPKLVWQSGCKYLGYLLGRRYRRLPAWLVRAITMNQRYWNHEREV